VGRDYPEWQKPLEPAQYLDSAAQGLGFIHVEVQDEESKGGYLKFLDNCVVLIVEEGDIGVVDIVLNLQLLFDKKWNWQLKEIEEFKYLVRSPPSPHTNQCQALSFLTLHISN
jgi:hypothetical protein